MNERINPGVDLDAYCARIGYTGPRNPTLETLCALHELHSAAIPFENIDVLLGHGIDISPAAVDAKLIAGHRGGYCYEHNGLFKRVLQAIGFEVEGLAARVHWRTSPDAPPLPRTHMALRVTLEGKPWLADVGFGGVGPTAPLQLDSTEPQPTRYETWRFEPCGDWLMLEAKLDEKWEPVYELSPEPQLNVDYIPPNWYTSTHPDSGFRKTLMVARTTSQARYTLSDNRLTVRTPAGRVEHRSLTSKEIAMVLIETFGLPIAPSWRTVTEAAANGA